MPNVHFLHLLKIENINQSSVQIKTFHFTTRTKIFTLLKHSINTVNPCKKPASIIRIRVLLQGVYLSRIYGMQFFKTFLWQDFTSAE